MNASSSDRSSQETVAPEPAKWIDDPHDIEQGQMLNPAWLDFHGVTAREVHQQAQTPYSPSTPVQPVPASLSDEQALSMIVSHAIPGPSFAVPASPAVEVASEPVSSRRTHHRCGAPLPTGVRRSDPGPGDDVPCSKCGAALDTGLECTECGHDMAPVLYATPPAVAVTENDTLRRSIQDLRKRDPKGLTTEDHQMLVDCFHALAGPPAPGAVPADINNALGLDSSASVRDAVIRIEDLKAAVHDAEEDGAGAVHGLTLLAKKHEGMRVDYSGLLGQCQRALRNCGESANAEMLRQFQGHMKELGERWYAGDTASVDEILQLYCVEKDARAALAATTSALPASKGDAS